MKVSNIFRDLIATLISCMMIAMGVAMIVTYDYGADPISLFQLGISEQSGLSLGDVALVYNIVLFIIAWRMNRYKLGLGTIVYTLCLGCLIDWSMTVLPHCEGSITLCLFILGQGLLCFGTASLLYINAGISSLDAIIEKLRSILHINYGVIKGSFDLLFSLLGILMGANAQWGSIYLAMTSGLFIEHMLVAMNKKVSPHGFLR